MAIEHARGLSRRTFLASAGLAATAALLAPTPRRLFAQQSSQPAVDTGGRVRGLVAAARAKAETARITVEKLRGNVSVLINEVGGNIAVLDGGGGNDGKLLVDAGLSGSRPQIAEALAGISDDPVKYVVNTHWHFDHTDGNQWLHDDAGATIIAHENVRKQLSETTRVEPFDHTFAPSPAGALPTMTLRPAGPQGGAAGMTLHLNGTTVRLDAVHPAHTDGDTIIEFADADVIHLGDLYWNGRYPFIDYGTGGSIEGMIRAAESNLGRIGAETIVIPGHGPVGDKSRLAEFRDMLVAVRDRVAALKKQGKSVQEVVAEKPTTAYDATWGGYVFNGALFTRLVYDGV